MPTEQGSEAAEDGKLIGGYFVAKDRGRYLPLSLPRRMVCDWLRYSQAVPLANGERRADLRPLKEAVGACRPRPNLLALFFKAYAMVAANRPILRRTYVPYPRPRLYEHPENVGSVVISRKVDGEDALFYLPITAPERLPIVEIERRWTEARHLPLHQIPAFRRQLRMARMPWPIRPLLLGLGMNCFGRHRVRFLGTYGMSVLASMGAATLTTLVPWTTMLHFTPWEDDGWLTIRIALDHRVLDGVEAALVGREIQEVLNGPIADEVRAMGAIRPKVA